MPHRSPGPICRITYPPKDLAIIAAETAREINPKNASEKDIEELKHNPGVHRLAGRIKCLWKDSVHLTVGFLDNPDSELRRLILSHMNAWNEKANVEFVETTTDPQIRIARFDEQSAEKGRDGYWSYLGTDILTIAKDEPTMNLEGFTASTSDAEFRRVVRHEAGHALGFEHEHMRSELIAKLDEKKVITEYMRMEGWSEEEVRRRVLTPIDPMSLFADSEPEPSSIMCYIVEPFLTLDFKGMGGTDITQKDHDFAARLYPK